ncbi:MAG: acyltransferase family protein [Dehalococcoidia bacterium]|nr:acyltransferase family protein [Dehalococcoidia bacterium]MDH4367145.1 acyltransferase family protein [Dehalococcoidia bacterium]
MKVTASRQYHIDWLRVIATIAIFLFHNARVYNFDDWHIKNAQTSLGATQFVEFMDMWMMPLFFILSGAAVYYSLKSRSAGSFLKERFFRIMIPWLVTGIFVIAPAQVYLERLSHGEFSGNFFQFFPHYFDGMYAFGGNFAWTGMHLWYLMMLSVFSVILLPMFLPRAKTGVSPAQSIAAKLGRPWVLPLLWVPVAAAALLSKPLGLGFTEQMGSWDVLSYAVFFVLGYMLFASTGLQEAIRKQGGWFLLAAVVFSAAHLILKFSIHPAFYEDIDIRLFATWGWIVGLFWLGGRFLNFTNRFLVHVNEMVLPFYILHQTVIVIVAYFVVQTGLAIPLKYGITAVISFAVIVALYELLVSRIGVLRFLFGMRKKAAAPESRRAAARAT